MYLAHRRTGDRRVALSGPDGDGSVSEGIGSGGGLVLLDPDDPDEPERAVLRVRGDAPPVSQLGWATYERLD